MEPTSSADCPTARSCSSTCGPQAGWWFFRVFPGMSRQARTPGRTDPGEGAAHHPQTHSSMHGGLEVSLRRCEQGLDGDACS